MFLFEIYTYWDLGFTTQATAAQPYDGVQETEWDTIPDTTLREREICAGEKKNSLPNLLSQEPFTCLYIHKLF